MNRTARLPHRVASPGSALGPAEAERARIGPPPGPHHFGDVGVERASSTCALPPRIANAMHALSGVPLHGVRVRYGSPEPARVRAQAFTRGNDIHVARGAEHHLAHEAWHVVQQRRGRVPVTAKTVTGHALNDDERLEREADEMARRALG